MLQEALNECKRGCAEIIDEDRIKKVLTNYFEDGKNYYVKAGFDPTASDLHLGHTVLLQKLATFQKYGAIIQFLIGDFTATIGDPTGKSKTRKVLVREEVLENTKSYTEQVFKILDTNRTEVVFNNDWLGILTPAQFLELMSKRTVARILERDDFKKRFKEESDIALHEFTYPLLQGYDSVVLKSDIELGGTDQKFNLLMGRTLQKSYKIGKEQAVMMMPILEGLDGINKMSKSLDNFIGINENKNSMFAKILSISDELMWRYYELLSSKTLEEIQKIKDDVQSEKLHPKVAKEILAMEIVDRFCGNGEGTLAKEEFDKVFKQNAIPTDIEEFTFDEVMWICKVLVETKITPSTSQARRDIKQGAVKLNQEKVSDENLQLKKGEYILQKGKKKFAKIFIK
jgi:tyrosyl-tRNA synthetase